MRGSERDDKNHVVCILFLNYIWAVKKVISIGLIFLLSVQCFYKLGVLTYYELNRDYIATVLCVNKDNPITMCYGKCFLKRNLDVADAAQKAPVRQGPERVDLPVFLISENDYNLTRATGPAPLHAVCQDACATGYRVSPFHPPSIG